MDMYKVADFFTAANKFGIRPATVLVGDHLFDLAEPSCLNIRVDDADILTMDNESRARMAAVISTLAFADREDFESEDALCENIDLEIEAELELIQATRDVNEMTLDSASTTTSGSGGLFDFFGGFMGISKENKKKEEVEKIDEPVRAKKVQEDLEMVESKYLYNF